MATRKDEGVPVSAAMVAAGRTVGEPRLSPDGTVAAFVATEDGVSQLVVVPAQGGSERPVTGEPAPSAARPMSGGVFAWVPDGSALVYAAKAGGLWSQPVTGGPARSIADGRAGGPAVSPDGTRVAFDLDQQRIVVAHFDGSPPVVLSGHVDFALDPAWSPDARTVAWLEWDVPAMPWDASRIVLAPADGSAASSVIAGGAGIQVQQPRFSPDGRSIAFLSDESGWLNVTVLDLDSGRTCAFADEHEHGAPTWGPGARSFAWSPDGRTIAVCRNEDGFGAVVRWEPGGAARPVAKAVHGGLSWRNGRLAATRTGARTPTQIVVYDGSDLGDRRTIAVGPHPLTDADLREPELVAWPSDDGVEIPGRLYRPPDAGPLPLICWIHGGPTDQWQVEWRPRFTYWLDRGWAILVPDHRGSTGHGRAFTQALAGRWGELDVVDAAAGMRAGVERGWARADQLVVMGASAGGFTALNLLATYPRLCAAGVDAYGVTDLVALDETDYRFEAHYLHSLIGPRPAHDDAYRSRSPLRRVDTIVDPLIVFQGRDDPVVSASQTESLVERLSSLGQTVDVHFYDGEGHGWSRTATAVDELEATESFLQRHVLTREDVVSDIVTCPACGSQYVASATVCTDCGAPLDVSPFLEPTDDEVGYDLSDWGDDERLQLAAALTRDAIPSRWDTAEVVVREVDADRVEVRIEEIDNAEELAAEDDNDDGGGEILSSLYVASDVLQSDPTASAAIVELIDACELASELGPPYGLERELWQEVQRRAAAIADLLGEGAEEEAVAGAAKALRDAVRPLV